MNVESLWLAHEHVNWETGAPDRDGEYEPGQSTHCSAFAAAAAKKLGVYMLRPPEHGQSLLASAQARWFRSQEGRDQGWRGARDAKKAQILANQGALVVVVYESPDDHKPGHIAIVRPSTKSSGELAEEGPEVIQAGQHNHNSTSVKNGFRSHPGAWPDGVRYYMHRSHFTVVTSPSLLHRRYFTVVLLRRHCTVVTPPSLLHNSLRHRLILVLIRDAHGDGHFANSPIHLHAVVELA